MNEDFMIRDMRDKELLSTECLYKMINLSKNFKFDDKEILKKIILIQMEIEKIRSEFFLQQQKLNDIYNSIIKNLLNQQDEFLKKISFSKDFWKNSLTNHYRIGKNITKEDFNLLGYLNNIEYTEKNNNDIFSRKLIFSFDNNPYFKNEIIEKEIFLNKDKSIEKIVSSKIDWFPNKNYTFSLTKKKIKNSLGDIKEIDYINKVDSFFNFFESVDFPSKEQLLLFKREDEYELISYFINEERVFQGIIDIIQYKFEYFFGFNKFDSSKLENYYEEMINKFINFKE